MSKDINQEIEEMAEKFEKSFEDPREQLIATIMTVGPEGIRAKLASLSEEEKTVLKSALQVISMRKAVSFDKEADGAKMIQGNIMDTIIQEDIANDDADEKLVKPEAATISHQGTPTDGWEGQVIKSLELTDAQVDAAAAAFPELLAEYDDDITKAYMGFNKLKGKLSNKEGVSDPAGLAAAIGRKKYGKQAFQNAAAKNKKMKKAKNPDEKEDAKLGEKIEQDVEQHMKRNKAAEKKEGHKIMKSEELSKKQGVPKGANVATHERCVQDVKDQGKSKSSAFAICNAAGAGMKKADKHGEISIAPEKQPRMVAGKKDQVAGNMNASETKKSDPNAMYGEAPMSKDDEKQEKKEKKSMKKSEELLQEILKSEDMQCAMVHRMMDKGWDFQDIQKACMSKGMDEKKIKAYASSYDKKDKKKEKEAIKNSGMIEKAQMLAEESQLGDSDEMTEGTIRAKKEKGDADNDEANKEAQDKVNDLSQGKDEKMSKSVQWTDENRLLKACTQGRNFHFNVNEYFDNEEKNQGKSDDKVTLTKSEKVDINDLLEKSLDKSWYDIDKEESIKKSIEEQNGTLIKSYSDKDLAESMGISEVELKKILGE
jgi:hypothetical protein